MSQATVATQRLDYIARRKDCGCIVACCSKDPRVSGETASPKEIMAHNRVVSEFMRGIDTKIYAVTVEPVENVGGRWAGDPNGDCSVCGPKPAGQGGLEL